MPEKASGPKINVNGLRIWAIYCVVFQHILAPFQARWLLEYTHWIFTIQALYVFVIFSGLGFSFQRQPKSLKEYRAYIGDNTFRFLRIYILFFTVQLLFYCAKPLSHVVSGSGTAITWPFTASHIVKQFLLPSSLPTATIWFMHLLVVASALWPVLVQCFSLLGFWTCFMIPFIIAFFVPMDYSLLRLLVLLPVLMLAYRFGINFRWTSKKKTAVNGAVWLVTVLSFIAFRDHFLPDRSYCELPFGERLTFQNSIHFIIIHANRICGAYFMIAIVGVMLGQFTKLKKTFDRLAFSSLDIYLLHKPYFIFIFGVIFIKPLSSRGVLESPLLIMLLAGFLSFMICYCSIMLGKLMRKSQWLSFYAFGSPKA